MPLAWLREVTPTLRGLQNIGTFIFLTYCSLEVHSPSNTDWLALRWMHAVFVLSLNFVFRYPVHQRHKGECAQSVVHAPPIPIVLVFQCRGDIGVLPLCRWIFGARAIFIIHSSFPCGRRMIRWPFDKLACPAYCPAYRGNRVTSTS